MLSFYTRFFVNFCVEMNVNLSNEFNFSDVYRIINYTGSLTKFTWTGSFTLRETQCSLYFDRHRKNEINSLNKICYLELDAIWEAFMTSHVCRTLHFNVLIGLGLIKSDSIFLNFFSYYKPLTLIDHQHSGERYKANGPLVSSSSTAVK